MDPPPPDDTEFYDASIHGKLCHLDAVDLSKLTLSKRYAMITLSGPWSSDDYGRFKTSGGALPHLPGLSVREAQEAVGSLIKENYILTWDFGGTTCWEVKGAYAFKPGLKLAKWQRKQLAIQKRKERALRRDRKKAADAGIAFAKEDDGGGVAEDGALIQLMRTKRGNVIPKRAAHFYRSTVPVPKGVKRDEMRLPQPDRPEGLNLRLLPPFNPSGGLSVLGAVLRHYLLMDCDDYGRVRLDVPRLNQQLGKAITKRVSCAQVKAELAAMVQSGHLMEIKKNSGSFAFVRDSAQHLLNKKRYDRDLPRLADSRDFTHDSEAYLAFYEACKEHSSTRVTVRVGQYNLRGDVHNVEEYVDVAADRFVSNYEELMKKEPWCRATPYQFCIGEVGNVMWLGSPFLLSGDLRLWHGITCDLPVHQLEQIYLEDQEMFDGVNGSLGKNGNAKKIFTHLLGMTVQRQLYLPPDDN
jgi:hypothetical protein